MIGKSSQSAAVPDTNPYKFGGKELDQVLSNYNFGARLFGTSLCRWTTMDPLREKYYSISPYTYCAANPVNRIDPNGMDWYIFDETGNYSQTIEHEGQHRLAVRTENEEGFSYRFYDFADPKNDPKDIDEHVINKLEFVSTEEIINSLHGAGTFRDSFLGLLNSKGGDRYDYYSQQIASRDNYQNKLFLPEGGRFAHNAQNFGIFLWGATGYILGWNLMALLLGAHYNSLFNTDTNGYGSMFDSVDDQRSIALGVRYARKHHLRLVKHLWGEKQ